MHTGSTLIPDSQQAMTWRIGDNGFCMSLSAEVPDLIEQQLKPNLSAWLKTQRLKIEDIKGWGVHPGGTRVLEAVQKSLQLDENDLRFSRTVLREHGNMSSATLLFILKQLRDNAVPRPWVMLGFGPGLEIEMALIH
jgi:predicted naringenin-chalcone synthase